VAGSDAANAASEVLLRRLALPPASAIHRMWVATRMCVQGDFDGAAQVYAEACEQQQRLGFFGSDALVVVTASVVDLLRGDVAAIGPRLELLDLISPQLAGPARILYAAATGQLGEARAMADALQPIMLRDWALLPALVTMGEAGLAAGSESLTRFAHDELRPYSGWLAVGGTSLAFGPVDLYLGRWSRMVADEGEARRLLDRARTDARERGLPYWAAQASAELQKLGSTSHSQVVR